MIQNEDRVLAYLDILGFRNIVKKWIEDPSVATTVENSLKRAVDWVGGRAALTRTTVDDWRLRLFSDCACVSQPATEMGILNLLEGVSFFQREMITSGFVIRGGVSVGKHYESSYTLMSHALIEAYELETKHAEAPRVLLSTRILRAIELIEDDEVRKEIKEFIVLDTDGIPFIFYMTFEEDDQWLKGHEFYLKQRDLITRMLDDTMLIDEVRSKYEWMAQFHNWCIRETAHLLKSSGTMSEDDVWSFSSLIVKNVDHESDFVSALWLDRAFSGANFHQRHEDVDWIKEWPGVLTEDDEPEDYA